MSMWRATFMFSDFQFGWSETLWWLNGSDSADTVLTAAGILGSNRKEMLGFGGQLNEVRVSDDLVFRDSLVGDFSPNGSSVYTSNQMFIGGANVNTFAIQPYADLLLRLESGTRYRKSLFLSGIPDYLYVNPFTGPLTDPTFSALYTSWANILLGSWGFKVSVTPDQIPTLPIPITGVTVIDNNLVKLLFAPGAAPVFLPNQSIHVRGLRMSPRGPRISGRYKPFIATLNDTTISAKGHLGQVFDPEGSPAAWADVQAVLGVTGIDQQGFSSHKRGRPFSSPRGRRRRT